MKILKPAGLILSRQEKLRSALRARKRDYLVVTHVPNLFYLTGFRGSAGIALFGQEDGILFVDPRYTLQAGEQAVGVEVREAKQSLLVAAGRWLRSKRAGVVAFEDGHLTYASWQALEEASARRARFRPSGGVVEDLRVVKDPAELNLIRQAARVTSRVFDEVRGLVKPGVSEADLGAEIEYRMKRHGAEGVAFETIVASGARAALPHARASSKLLKKHEFVIFDLGGIISGYAADMTRTVYLGKPDARVRRIYQAVLRAEQSGIQGIKAGVRAGKVDSSARKTLARYGLANYFTHSTGHGVGIEIHEKPRLGRGEKQRLMPGAVVTVEPGVYLEGFGGVRIEDTVVVSEDGAEVLTSSSKADWVIA